ncbi:MAG: GIY-YIG nuclease family protein, partial [bacterium]|nr:GIY-YIG nuclease family protein [bacterium]
MKKKEIPLTDLDVLVLDCQATTANPETGHLIEIGWSRIRPVTGEDNPPEPVIQSHLVRLPEEVEISRRVSLITGLKTEDLEQGLEPGTAWKKLLKTAKTITTANKRKPCPAVIHYARFEEPYLHHLHQQHSHGKPFPLQIICTHQVMRRLFPTLPRKGLRAAAGYLGHSVPELRRAAHHTAATAFVWHQVVQLLEEQDIRTLDQLSEWLASPPPSTKKNGRVFPMPPAVRLDLPRKPGIYRMLRSNGDLLYIGKATSLRNRVNSYFYKKKGGGHAEHTMEMLSQAAGLETIVTGSALEAALLESDEIKKHAPPYNVALRKRDRETAFFSKDLLHATPGTDDGHPIGPLPSPASLAPLGILGEILAAPRTVDWDNPELPPAALGSRPEYAPDGDCFNEGFQLFRQRNEEELKILDYSFTFTKNPLLGFMTLGRKF